MMDKKYPFIPYKKEEFSTQEMLKRSVSFYTWLDQRRSVRDFSSREIDEEVIDNILLSASTAPSGAHKQPWTFCVVRNPKIKSEIRKAAEAEEKESYSGRMTKEWLEDLAPLGTNWEKEFLEIAPVLIVVFKRSYEYNADGTKRNNYYVTESLGLACGFLLAAIHNAGLVALTHTPSPMNFLSKILDRPDNEKPFLLIPVGYPSENATVPDLKRKSIEEIVVKYT
jgi:iodotyrosine deiodinase